jgi:hypothetical protein
MGAIVAGMATGYLAAQALGFGERGVQSAVVAALTLAAGSSGRLRTALPVALAVGLVVVAASTLGAVTTGHPWAAALAMAAIAFLTSVLTAAQPVGLLIGMVTSYAYFLVTGTGVIAARVIGRDLPEIGVLSLVGLAAGLVLVVVRALVEQALHPIPDTPPGPRTPLLAPVARSVRTFDRHAQDGVRRAIALGLAMYAFQSIATHDAFWVMLTVFVILLPNGRSTVGKALARVAGTVVGVGFAVVITSLLPDAVVGPLAVLALAISLALSTRSAWLSVAMGAVAASVLTGLPRDDVAGFAAARLVDTLIGTALALAAGYLLWPRAKPEQTPVPSGLAADASETGVTARPA